MEIYCPCCGEYDYRLEIDYIGPDTIFDFKCSYCNERFELKVIYTIQENDYGLKNKS
jgi:transposase-like protein